MDKNDRYPIGQNHGQKIGWIWWCVRFPLGPSDGVDPRPRGGGLVDRKVLRNHFGQEFMVVPLLGVGSQRASRSWTVGFGDKTKVAHGHVDVVKLVEGVGDV